MNIKPAVENCTAISIGKLQKNIRKSIAIEYPDISLEETYVLLVKEFNEFTVNNQKFQYTSHPNKLGGQRWFFICPKCNKKAMKLLLPPESSNLENRYLCKKCHKLKNLSAMMGNNKLYRNVLKPMKKMKEIEQRIEKGYLNPDRVKVLLDEYDVLEKQMKSTPEFRLYRFKKIHGIK